MKVNCKHWSDVGQPRYGRCGIGLHGGLPSAGVCRVCQEREPIESEGLGDTIAKATKSVGIKPCGGCKKRRELLNRLWPYKKKGE